MRSRRFGRFIRIENKIVKVRGGVRRRRYLLNRLRLIGFAAGRRKWRLRAPKTKTTFTLQGSHQTGRSLLRLRRSAGVRRTWGLRRLPNSSFLERGSLKRFRNWSFPIRLFLQRHICQRHFLSRHVLMRERRSGILSRQTLIGLRRLNLVKTPQEWIGRSLES